MISQYLIQRQRKNKEVERKKSVTMNFVIFENKDDFKNAGLLAIQTPDTAANPKVFLFLCLHPHHSGMPHPKYAAKRTTGCGIPRGN
jgi:hypothetical protein